MVGYRDYSSYRDDSSPDPHFENFEFAGIDHTDDFKDFVAQIKPIPNSDQPEDVAGGLQVYRTHTAWYVTSLVFEPYTRQWLWSMLTDTKHIAVSSNCSINIGESCGHGKLAAVYRAMYMQSIAHAALGLMCKLHVEQFQLCTDCLGIVS